MMIRLSGKTLFYGFKEDGFAVMYIPIGHCDFFKSVFDTEGKVTAIGNKKGWKIYEDFSDGDFRCFTGTRIDGLMTEVVEEASWLAREYNRLYAETFTRNNPHTGEIMLATYERLKVFAKRLFQNYVMGDEAYDTYRNHGLSMKMIQMAQLQQEALKR